MPRTARLDSPGTLHHVIIRGIERRSIVNDNRDREEAILVACGAQIEDRSNCQRKVC
jgi:putative transposase